MPTYSVETRFYFGDGDYNENHQDFDTPDEVRNYIKNDMHEDERLHSVLEYADGQTSNPRDVTRKFSK